jgi:magnesium and cobalt transporter
MRLTRHKKVPVYDGQRDDIVGLVYAKVLFLNPGKPLRQLLQPARFVPELATCEQLLHHFRSTKTQQAIALDEYGGVAGLVTLEDVLEEIVGELHAPEDEPPEPELVARSDGEYEISGQLSVHYWIEAFALPAQVERVATVGGLVMARLGRSARVGDAARFGNVELQVTRMKRRRIERLRLRLLDQAGRPESAP